MMMPYQFGSPSPASHHFLSWYHRSYHYPHLARSRSVPGSLLLGCCCLVFLLLLLQQHPQPPQQESTIITTTTTTGARHRRIFFIAGFPLTHPATRAAPCRPVIVASSSVSPALAASLAASPFRGDAVGWVSAPSWCNSRGRRSHRDITTTTTTTILRNQKTDETEGEESAAPAESTALGTSSSSWLWTLVVPLLFVYVSNQWSRSSIYYLVDFSDTALATASASAAAAGGAGAVVASSSSELAAFRAMNLALDFDQTQYGILASVAFTALFGIASLGAGIASDRWDRKKLTIGSSAGWALASFGTAVATTYPEVVGWRILMGLCCAFTTPTAYTLINERVPTANKSFATSLYGTGVAFGGALASLSILLDTEYGWKNTMLIISVVGFLSSFLSLLLLPPDDTAAAAKIKNDDTPERIGSKSTSRSRLPTDDDTSTSTTTNTIWQDVVVAVTSNARTKWIYLGSFLRFSSGLCIGVWSAPYFRQAFPDNAQQYAIAQAVITAVGGSVSGLLGGTFADQLATSSSSKSASITTDKTTEDNNDIDSETGTNTKLVFGMIDTTGIQEPRLIVPVIGSLLAVPCWYSAMHTTQDFNLAMVYLATEYLVAECWFGPTISSLLTTVEPKVTGTAQGLFTLTGAVANLSPSLLGFLYGQASGASTATGGGTSSTEDLVNLLSNGVCFGYISCAICFAIAAQSSAVSPSISSTSSNNNSNKAT